MKVAFELSGAFENRKEIKKTVNVNFLDANLTDMIDDIIGSRERLSFGAYYENEMLMYFNRCYPYILKEGKIEWMVPYEDVTINDFINTHKIKDNPPIIKVYVNDYGGGGNWISTEIIQWIIFGWPLVIKGVITIGGIFTFGDYIGKVVKHFKNKYNVMPVPTDVAEAINKNRTWKMDELKSVLGISDESFIEMIMFCCGYKKKKESKVFTRNLIEYRRMRDKHYDYISDCWSPSAEYYDDEKDEFCEIKNNVQYINVLITDIKMHSAINDSDCFEIVQRRVDLLRNSFRCLKKGKYFEFLIFNETLIKCDIEFLEEELLKTISFLEFHLTYLTDKEKASACKQKPKE